MNLEENAPEAERTAQAVRAYKLEVRSRGEVLKQGTAWLQGPDMAVTAFHVVGASSMGAWLHEAPDAGAGISYHLIDGADEVSLDPAACDPRADVALLRCRQTPTRVVVLALANERPAREAGFRAVGFPAFHRGEPFTVTGKITEVRGEPLDRALQLLFDQGSQADWEGLSGTAVLAGERVVGVLTEITSGVETGWAASSETVWRLARIHDASELRDACRELLLKLYPEEQRLAELWTRLEWRRDRAAEGDRSTVAAALVERAMLYSADGLVQLLDAVARDHPTSDPAGSLRARILADAAVSPSVNLGAFAPVLAADIGEYLRRIVRNAPTSVDLPHALQEAFGTGLRALPAEVLHQFTSSADRDSSKRYLLHELVNRDAPSRILLMGESGIGKSSLMRQLVVEQARRCLELKSDVLPVLVELSQYKGGDIEALVQTSLARFGVTVKIHDLRQLLSQGQMLLLLDAYDEVLDSDAPHLDRAVHSIADIAGNSRLIVTTRPFCRPRVGFGREFRFEPLASDAIERFLEKQFGPELRTQFLSELKRNHLRNEASNTLLLSLLVLLYERSRRLPSSRRQIMAHVIEGVNQWEKSKFDRVSTGLGWRGVKIMLERLALRALLAGDGYRLDLPAAETIVVGSLTELKQASRVSPMLTVDEALREMESTGFARREAQGIIFWHRAFMEYFAALEAARRLDAGELMPEALAHTVSWEYVLPMALAQAKGASALIRRVIPINIFCAARALVEMDAPEEPLVEEISKRLARRCRAAVHSIRHEAVSLLCRLRGESVDRTLLQLLEDAPAGVQMVALREVAMRGLPEARAIVEARIDWEPATLFFLEGSPKTAVLEALGELGDEESQRAILKQWKAHRDIVTGGAASAALIATIERGTFTTEMRDALVDWMVSTDAHEEMVGRGSVIARVLIRLGDTSIVLRLADYVERARHDTYGVNWDVERMLGSFNDPGIAVLLLERAANEALPMDARIRFARVLSESRAAAPLEKLRALFDRTDNCRLRAFVLAGLARFPYSQIEKSVHAALVLPKTSELERSGREYDFLQATAFRVLARHRQLDLLLDSHFHPTLLSYLGIDALAEAVAAQHLVSFAAWFKQLLDVVPKPRHKTALAYALAELGEVEHAVSMIERLLERSAQEPFILHDIAAGAHRLPEPQALHLVREVWSRTTASRDDGGYLRDVCIEAFERIGSEAACEELCRITEQVIQEPKSLDQERALRGVALLATPTRERWLLELLGRRPAIDRSARSRALYALGFIGTEESIPTLERAARNAPEEVRDLCFRMIQAIHRRKGRVWFGGEEAD